MNIQVDVDDAQIKAATKAVSFLEDAGNRKTVIEAANEGLANALRRHFSNREREPHAVGWWNIGQGAFPKRYFWRGTRGTSVAEKMHTTLISPARLEARIAIDSPALAHKLNPNPPPIRPTGGRKLLAIPANPEAAQWSGMARDFPGGLRFAYSRLAGYWLPCLIAAANYKNSKGRFTSTGKGAKTGENDVVYWLVHQVVTRHDPRALPSAREQHSAVQSAVMAAIARLLQG